MTTKEAIQTIEAAKAEVEWNYPLDYAAAFEAAIKALEKQISKEPKQDEEYPLGRICPGCYRYLSNVQFVPSGYHYCENCGQRLEWGDEE